MSEWCVAFYVCKQHMVSSQLLKLTTFLGVCLNARSYRKCIFITYYFSFDSRDRFLESALRRFFFLCYHYFAFMLMLIFFLCLSPIALVISSYNFLPPVMEYISSLWAFCCFLKFYSWLAAMELLHIICLSCKTLSSGRYENCCFWFILVQIT